MAAALHAFLVVYAVEPVLSSSNPCCPQQSFDCSSVLDIHSHMFCSQGDGTFALYNNSPADARISSHEVADIGKTAAVVLADPAKYVGQTVAVASDMVTFDGIASTISEVTGKTLKYVAVPTEKAAAMGYPGAADLANMFEYYTSFDKYNGARNWCHKLLRYIY